MIHPSVRTFLVLSCTACLAWLGLAPSSLASSFGLEPGRRNVRPSEQGGRIQLFSASGRMLNLQDAMAGAMYSSATAEGCTGPCAGCAGALVGVIGSTAVIALTCGGTVFTAGLSLAGCWISIVGAQGVVLLTASNCSACNSCMSDQPDPETPPGGGPDDDDDEPCEPCDPLDPLINCPEIDLCGLDDDKEP